VRYEQKDWNGKPDPLPTARSAGGNAQKGLKTQEAEPRRFELSFLSGALLVTIFYKGLIDI
jgi:hypothetical protein